jgi:WD40 repeat protein/subtilisin-like proprotein convertase family protein
MASVTQGFDFFVVGGPVDPERPCYVVRAGDVELASAIAARELCCVLGPRGIGKSSAARRAARTARAAGDLCALVELEPAQIRGDSDTRGWLRSVATQIARQVGLAVDVDDWWRRRASGAVPLADFLWQVLLTNTTAPITVFLDGIEHVTTSPAGAELLAAVAVCRLRRGAEPDYARLTFVVLGIATLRELVRGERGSPFAEARLVDLADFTSEEAYLLAHGFGGGGEQALALMDRVLTWTSGQPYLTQKLARAVERKGGRLEDVERAVREQWLTPVGEQEDSLFVDTWARLARRDVVTRQAVRLLRRLSKGGRVVAVAGAPALEILQLAGVVTVAPDGAVAYRNRLYRELIGGRWLRSVSPVAGKIVAVASVLLIAVAAGAVWYLRYLPAPMIAALSSPDTEAPLAEDAYRRLRRLPGFGERAATLYADYLTRSSGGATVLADVLANDARVRDLGDTELADRLLGDFWFRKAEQAEREEQRDAGILYALRAETVAQSPALLAELVGTDYQWLVRTARLPAAPLHWTVDWRSGIVATLDAANNIARLPLPPATDAPDLAGSSIATRLTALQYAPLQRELNVDVGGSAGAFELVIEIAHPATAELLLILTAPGGAQASVAVPQGSAESESYVFSAAPGSPLAALADSDRRGVWRLTVVDRAVDNAGYLGGWALRFGEEERRDELPEPLSIPDCERTADVSATVLPGGGFAWAAPTTPGALGSVALWSLAEARLDRDFALRAAPTTVALNAGATRLLAASRDGVTLADVATGAAIAQLTTQTEFMLPPAFSSDGGFFMVAERVDEAPPLFSLLSADDGSLVASSTGVADARDWVLGPGGRYVAVRGDSDELRVLDPRTGMELARLAHPREVRRVLPLADGASLLTVDAAGDVRIWRLGAASASGHVVATTTSADTVSLAANGTRLVVTAIDGSVRVIDPLNGAELAALLHGDSAPPTRALLSADATTLVTQSGNELRRYDLSRIGAPVGSASLLPADVTAVALAGDAQLIALGTRGGQLMMRKPAQSTGSALDYFGHRGAVTSVAVDARTGVAVSGGRDGTVRIWDVASGAPREGELTQGAVAVTAVALSPDAARIASAGGAMVRIWQTANGALLSTLPTMAAASALAFAPDGESLAIGDAAGTILVRSGAESEPPLQTLRGDAAVTSLAISSEGLVLAGDAAGAVRLWRLADSHQAGAAVKLRQAVRWVGFSHDGRHAFAVGDHWLHSFAVDPAGLAALHARPVSRPLLPGQPLVAGTAEQLESVTFGPAGLEVTSVDLGVHVAPPLARAIAGRDWPIALGLEIDAAGLPVPR